MLSAPASLPLVGLTTVQGLVDLAHAQPGQRILLTESSGAQLTGIAAPVETGAIGPVIDTVFDFADLPAAMDRLGAGHSRGKLVLRVNPVKAP